MRSEINKLIAEGVIEPSTSEWCSAAIVVPKQDESIRCVIDFCAVNKVVENEGCVMPRIDDLINRIGNAKYLKKIDPSSSFHQVALDAQSKQFTSFCTPFGQFQYTRLPYGLKTSPLRFTL